MRFLFLVLLNQLLCLGLCLSPVTQAFAQSVGPSVPSRLQKGLNLRPQGLAGGSSYTWRQFIDNSFVNALVGSPGQNNNIVTGGWTNYGKVSTANACQAACDNDSNCWAYTWQDNSQGDWSQYCYGRQPWTGNYDPYAWKPQTGHFAGYKVITSFGDLAFKPVNGGTNLWAPLTSWTASAGKNYFSGSFGSPTTEYHNQQQGTLVVSNSVSTSKAQLGAINIGTTIDEAMCADAANFMLYQDLSVSTPNIVANYYSYMDSSAGDWAYLCFIGSAPNSNSPQDAAHSGTRAGTLPPIGLYIQQ